MKLEEKLIEFRKKAGYTQQEIADLLNCERSTYAGYETGKTTIPIKKIQLLSVIYNLDYNAFNPNTPIILHAPDPEDEELDDENNKNRLTKAERMLLAKMRLIRANNKSMELDEALNKLIDSLKNPNK